MQNAFKIALKMHEGGIYEKISPFSSETKQFWGFSIILQEIWSKRKVFIQLLAIIIDTVSQQTAIAQENWNKPAIELYLGSPILLDFVSMCQVFR